MKTLLLTITLTVCGTAQAGVYSPKIDERQHNQHHRIANGYRTGSLTAVEAYRLGKQQVNINRTEKRFESDGRLTLREKAILTHKQDHASAAIYRQKHDRQRRR